MNGSCQFYALAEFSNSGCLGAPEVFRNAFAKPIERSRDPQYNSILFTLLYLCYLSILSCKKAVKEAGEARAKELYAITQARPASLPFDSELEISIVMKFIIDLHSSTHGRSAGEVLAAEDGSHSLLCSLLSATRPLSFLPQLRRRTNRLSFVMWMTL